MYGNQHIAKDVTDITGKTNGSPCAVKHLKVIKTLLGILLKRRDHEYGIACSSYILYLQVGIVLEPRCFGRVQEKCVCVYMYIHIHVHMNFEKHAWIPCCEARGFQQTWALQRKRTLHLGIQLNHL